MKQFIKDGVYRVLRSIGIEKMLSAPNNCLRVLCYHDITDKGGFAKQLAFLQAHYQPISAAQLESHLMEGEPLPDRSVLLTFDDAYPDLYYKGLPLLRRYGMSGVVFVITNLVGSDIPYWWDEILHHSSAEEGSENLKKAKELPNPKRLRFIENLRSTSGRPALKRRQLGWAELKELEDSGILVANHTYDHPLLDQCSPETVINQIHAADRILDDKGCRGKKYFAYPNGNGSNVAEEFLRENEFAMVFKFDHQVNKKEINPMRISRLSVNSDVSISEFRFILSGAHSRLLNWRKKLF